MEVGRIEAVLTAHFDKDPFDKYDKAFNKTDKEAKRGIKTEIKTHAPTKDLDTYTDKQGKLRQNNKQLVDSNDRINKSNKRVGGSFRTLGGNAVKAAAGAGALFAAYRVGKDAVQTTVELAKASMGLSRATGMEINQASRLVSVAKARNVDSQKLGMTFTIFSKQIKAANSGSAKAVENFKALGISQKELKREDTTTLFMRTADGLHAMKNGWEKTSTAQSAFGKSYAALFPLLDLGSAGIQEQIDLAARMGAELGTNNPDKIKKAIEAQRELSLAMVGLKLTLGKTLIPVLADGAKKVADFVKQFKDNKGKGKEFKDTLIGIRDTLKPIVKLLADHPRLVGGAVLAWVAFKKVVGAFNLMKPILKGLGKLAAWTTAGLLRGTAFGEGMNGAAVGATFGKAVGKAIPAAIAIGLPLGVAGITLGIGDWLHKQITPQNIGNDTGLPSALENAFGFTGGITDRIKKDWNQKKKAFADGWNAIKGIFGGGKGHLAAIRAPKITGLAELVKKVGSAMGDAAAKVGDWAARAYTNAKHFGSNIAKGIGDWLERIPGRVRNWLGKSVDAIGNAASSVYDKAKGFGRSIVNGIVNAIKGAPRAIVNAIEGLLPNSLRAKVASILGFAHGGKVGAGAGGAQLFIAGEGRKSEWVISQEGDRRKNVGWAMDALETLTGQPIAMYGDGGRVGRASGTAKPSRRQKAQWNADIGKVRGLFDTNLLNNALEFDLDIAQSEGGSDTLLGLGKNNGWDSIINAKGSTARAKSVARAGRFYFNKYLVAKQSIGELRGLLQNPKTYSLKDRANAARRIAGLFQNATEYRNTAGGYWSQAHEAATTTSTGQTALEKLAEGTGLSAGHRSLMLDYGSNVGGTGSGRYSTGQIMQGGVLSGGGTRNLNGSIQTGGGVGASGATVRITNNYQAPPEDPHSWSQALKYELKAAL